MRFMIGYQMTADNRFLSLMLRNKEKIGEVYFAWPDIPSYIVGNSFRKALETVLTNCPECVKSDCKSCGEELKTVLTNWQPGCEK